jgi:hypothetical protein
MAITQNMQAAAKLLELFSRKQRAFFVRAEKAAAGKPAAVQNDAVKTANRKNALQKKALQINYFAGVHGGFHA